MFFPQIVKLTFAISTTSFHTHLSIATDGSGGDTDISQKYEDQSWDKLKLCIEAVFNQKPISFLYDELYRAVENMCTHNMASLLYQNLEAECKSRVLSVVRTFQQYPTEGKLMCI